MCLSDLGLRMKDLVVVYALVIVAMVDLWLIFTHQRTISQRYQALFPTSFDMVLMVTFICLVYNAGLDRMVQLVLGALAGHLFWPNKERHK